MARAFRPQAAAGGRVTVGSPAAVPASPERSTGWRRDLTSAFAVYVRYIHMNITTLAHRGCNEKGVISPSPASRYSRPASIRLPGTLDGLCEISHNHP